MVAKFFGAVIVGVICTIVFTISGFPFALLLAIILAVFNIIPFFGAIIGPAIGALILLVIDPGWVLGFLVISFVIMQIDGNYISPRLIGRRVGLGSFWIIVSLLAGGRMFGFWGMFLGAPVFAVIYAMIRRGIRNRLQKRGLPIETEDYFDFLRPQPETPEERAARRKQLFARFSRKKKKRSKNDANPD